MIGYKHLLLGLFCLIGTRGYLQNNSQMSQAQADHRDLFSGIQSQHQYQGTLLNRNLSVHESLYQLDGVNQITPMNLESWIKVQGDLWNALSDNDLANHPSSGQFLTQLGQFYQPQYDEGELNEIPIGILNYTVTNIRQEAFEQGRIGERNGQYADLGLTQQDFVTMNVFSVVPLADALLEEEVTFVFDPQFFFTNVQDPIQQIKVDFGDGLGLRQVSMGDRITVNYGQTAAVQISGEIKFSSGLKSGFLGDLQEELGEILLGRLLTPIFFDEIETVSHSGRLLEYGIKYSDCNQGLKKPLIIAHGLLPTSTLAGTFITTNGADDEGFILEGLWDITLWNLYQKFNFSSTLESLRDAGYDIVIVRLRHRYTSLQIYGELVAKVIKEINAKKLLNGSHFENGAIGYSLGGMAIRYALNKMEKDVLNNVSNDHHHTRIFTSYDVGHLGNTAPLGVQTAIGYAREELNENGLRLNTIHYILNTKMAKSSAMFHYSNTYPSGGYQAPHSLRSDFADAMDAQAHGKTIVTGYPAFSRNIAISQGSRTGVENPPYAFNDGGYLYDKSGPFETDVQIRAASASGTHFIYSPHIGMADWYHYNSSMPELDNAPGSYEFGLYSNGMKGIANAYRALPVGGAGNVAWQATSIDSDCDEKNGGPWTFVPVVSAFGLNIEHLSINNDWNYNLDANGLMYDSPGNLNPSYGYPAVGHPGDHWDRTPFEALCITNENSHHIVGKRPEDEISSDCEFKYGSLATHQYARDFIAAELVPDKLKLQNKEIGENTRADLEYRAHYEAREEIAFGREVTWATDREDFIVNPNGHIESRAGDFIELEPGFEVEFGGFFIAEIQPVSCFWTRPADPSGRTFVAEEEAITPESTTDFADEKLVVFPNPSQGKFTLELKEAEEPFQIIIFDLQGRQVFTGNFNTGQHQLDLSDYDHGIYIINAHSNDETHVKRIVIQ